MYTPLCTSVGEPRQVCTTIIMFPHKAQFILGVMYREGYGVSKDNEKANEWFAKAAEED